MGSFQQITMGIICLVAAFWFGSFLQDQPVGQRSPDALLPEGKIDPNQSSPQSNLLAHTKGFLSSLFESEAAQEPITVADLRQQSLARTANAHWAKKPESPPPTGNAIVSVPVNSNANQNPIPGLSPQTSPQTSLQTASSTDRVAIVPDFSSLADEVNRGLSFNSPSPLQSPPQSGVPTTHDSRLPVPQFSNALVNRPNTATEVNWETVQDRVAEAETRLKNHRDDMTQPIAAIEQSVLDQTRAFEQRRTEKRPRTLPQTIKNRRAVASRSSTPESWTEKQDRWDVFSNRRDRHTNGLGRKEVQQGNFQSRDALASRSGQRIVEVSRSFTPQRSQPTAHGTSSPDRVRSLNDDRTLGHNSLASDGEFETHRRDNQLASSGNSQPSRLRNQLRPPYDPNPGSEPEFVSPPKDNLGDSRRRNNHQADSKSPIVTAAEGSYGSFREYQTQPGDTLQTISEKFYGTPNYYFDLYLANRTLLSNPASVPEGRNIKIPRFDTN